jgi:hypothetical protein
MNIGKKKKSTALFVCSAFMFSLLSAYAAYHNLFEKAQCTYGGSKLSWFFGVICESFGSLGVVIVWLILSLLSLAVGLKVFLKN